MHLIDKLAWIEIKDKSILSTRSYGKSNFYLPGGKREAGETDTQALCREIREELSVELDSESMELLGVFQAAADGHPDGVMVQMTCYWAGYEGKLQAAAEIEEVQWLTSDDKDRISAVDKLIFDYLKERELIR
jgi:ADP-ribose pyrophosphatase YjhB (NUDIX family)